jgi:hypothetical protein
MTTATFVPAWYCADADLTLMWDTQALGWELRYRGRLIKTLPGYPVGAPANGEREARAWADGIAGPQEWIRRPGSTFHTHPGGCEDRAPG